MYKFLPIRKILVWGTEDWVLSGVPGSESVVAEGPDAGKTLSEVYGGEFPLLVKFIDARRDLSIQVHPGDELALKRHGCRGKSEMWYIIGAAEGAHLYSGLAKPMTPEEYERRVEDGSITEVLGDFEVAPGDVFFIPSGRIHSICGGCYLAEIQETSDITYRIYDYKRPGLDGKPRQLHTELAKEAIDYKVYPDYKTHYTPAKNARVELVSCPFFLTCLYDVDSAVEVPVPDSFVAVICVAGNGTLDALGQTVTVRQGETVLVPACAGSLRLTGKLKVLTTQIP